MPSQMKIRPGTLVYTVEEFKEFMKDKKVMHAQVYWFEYWNEPIFDKGAAGRIYFPYNGFLVPATFEPKPYRYYGKHAYCWPGHDTITWSVSYNEKNKRFYVSQRDNRPRVR